MPDRKKIKTYIILIAVLLAPSIHQVKASPPESAEMSSLSGFVSDSTTGETLIGATVSIKKLSAGAYTNKNGFYSITNIKPGIYAVSVSFIGFRTKTDTIKFVRGKPVRRDFIIIPTSVTTNEISVEGRREDKRIVNVSKIDVPLDQIKNLRIGGESDVFRTLQYLPGILTSSQISSGLFIRGGSPDQNLVLIDGATVYNPSHLFGFISTFNTEAIKDVELIKGGFPAEYGGRLSAVLNLTQKDGNRNHFGGVASIGAISSKAALEGPLFNGSWFLSGRRTYFELIKAFLPNDPTEPIPDYSFYDLNGKVTQDISKNDRIFLSGFMSSDALDYSSFGFKVGLDIGNRSGSIRWNRVWADNLFSTLLFSNSYYYNEFAGDQNGYGFNIDNTITDYTLKGNVEWNITEDLLCKSGFEITKYNFKYLYNFTGEQDSVGQKNTTSAALTNIDFNDLNYSAYSQFSYNFLKKYTLQAGLRANYWTLADIRTYDPRIALRYQFNELLSLKAAWGIYHQNLRLATQPDFSFFDTWMPTDSTLPESKAQHFILSLESKWLENYTITVDAYYKKMTNISELNTTILSAKVARDIFYIGNAESYGVELFVQKRYGKLQGWIGYALGFIEAKFDSINGGRPFRPKYDRRHDFKAVATYFLNDDWELGASFTFQSGQSYTGATSRFESRLPGRDIGRGIIVPSQRYGLRLPATHYLNLSASYNFKMLGMKMKASLDIYNVYNRRDIWFRYYDTRTAVTQVKDVLLLPILPSLSIEARF